MCSCGTRSLRRLLEHLGVDGTGVLALVLVRQDDVHAVRVIADVLVDPVELDLELFGGEPTAPSTPNPHRLAHGDDDVAAVG
jgi:hypothetical protein